LLILQNHFAVFSNSDLDLKLRESYNKSKLGLQAVNQVLSKIKEEYRNIFAGNIGVIGSF
jgi:hypothetical protein